MVVEHAHSLRQRRGPNANSLHKAHLAPDAGLQARRQRACPLRRGSHDFESLDRGIGREVDLKPRTGLISILSFP